jgi:hypothetical protein
MGGNETRTGKSPNHPRSSRREVSRNLALLLRRPLRFRAFREPGHRLHVVPDPQHRHLPQYLQGDFATLRIVQREPVDARLLQRFPERLPDLVQHAR